MGYKVAFWNCRRKLISDSNYDSNKLVDAKAYIETHKPLLFAIIESDIHSTTSHSNRVKRYSTKYIDEKLKVQVYTIQLPDTWEEHGQARLIVYVSEELNDKRKPLDAQFRDLPNVTLEIGLGREKKTLVNFFYREWTGGVSGLGNQASQVERLERQ